MGLPGVSSCTPGGPATDTSAKQTPSLDHRRTHFWRNLMIFVSRINNDAGLGDLIVQTNWIYRLARRFGCQYVHVPLKSLNHLKGVEDDCAYDRLLGLRALSISTHDLPKRVVDIRPFSIELFCQEVEAAGHRSEDTHLRVAYPYVDAEQIDDHLQLMELDAFPWLHYLPACETSSVGQRTTVALHVRLGDSFAYPLGDGSGRCFDARRRVIVDADQIPPQRRWTLDDVDRVIRSVTAAGMELALLTDGIATGLKTVKSGRLRDDDAVSAPVLLSAIQATGDRLAEMASRRGVTCITGNLGRDLSILRTAEFIVWTEGIFARKINEFLRPVGARICHVLEFSPAWLKSDPSSSTASPPEE